MALRQCCSVPFPSATAARLRARIRSTRTRCQSSIQESAADGCVPAPPSRSADRMDDMLRCCILMCTSPPVLDLLLDLPGAVCIKQGRCASCDSAQVGCSDADACGWHSPIQRNCTPITPAFQHTNVPLQTCCRLYTPLLLMHAHLSSECSAMRLPTSMQLPNNARPYMAVAPCSRQMASSLPRYKTFANMWC